MLRPVFAISILATAVVLSGCQSIMAYGFMNQGNTQVNGTQISYAPNTYSKSTVDYNRWQWEYLTKKYQKVPTSNSNVMTVREPIVSAEANEGDNWGYSYQSNTVHPNNWGNVSGGERCATGRQQSPINISQALIPAKTHSKNQIQYAYQLQDFVVTNNGHTIVFTAVDDKASNFIVNGKEYQLIQFQYRSPSEHTIMNVNYPLELQFVHQSAGGEMAIISSLVNIGQQNLSLQTVIDHLPSATSKELQNKLTDFNVSALIPKGNFYAYTGSWTMPPCSENTPWLIGSQTIKASSAQIYSLRSRFYGNNRPIQPQNDRTVFMIK